MAKTRYVWSSVSDSVLQEKDGNTGATKVTYTNEPTPYGPLRSERRGSETRQYRFDALGSTRALTDDDQAVTDTFAYDVWGSQLTSIGANPTAFTWIGQFGYRSHTSLSAYYVRARVYSSSSGRWMSRDPSNSSDGLNLYVAYFVPHTIDPSGLAIIRVDWTDGEAKPEDYSPLPKQTFRPPTISVFFAKDQCDIEFQDFAQSGTTSASAKAQIEVLGVQIGGGATVQFDYKVIADKVKTEEIKGVVCCVSKKDDPNTKMFIPVTRKSLDVEIWRNWEFSWETTIGNGSIRILRKATTITETTDPDRFCKCNTPDGWQYERAMDKELM